MEALGAALQPVMGDEEEMPKKKGLFDRCEKHSMPYDYWVTGTTEFFCRKCAKENRQVDIELIEEAIPQVKEALAAQIPNAMKKVESDLESFDENHKRLVMNRNNIQNFMKAVQTLDDKFKQEIKQNAASKAKVLESASELTKLRSKVDKIATPADLQVVGEMNSTVKKVAAHSSVPTSDLPLSLLSNIACSYVVSWLDHGRHCHLIYL
jgi:ribosomal protein L16 Arg81 hydroxylase